MDYEKKYKEALEKARQLCAYPTTKPFISDLQDIFPELAESEDERIRKEILTAFSCGHDNSDIYGHGITYGQVRAWLEKQGEHANFLDKIQIGDKVTRNEDGVLVNLSQLNRVAKKQGEQNLADKDEPKFREGEWITNGDYTWQIVSVTDLDYILESQNRNIVYDTISHVDEQFHSFTIEDAKDGMILIDKSNNRECPFIFKETKPSDIKTDVLNPLTVLGYCGIGGAGFTKGSGWGDTANCIYYPATKEQCGLLFQKMHEAEYEWNSDKKELKKIEQKQEWSEKDKRKIGRIYSILQQAADTHAFSTSCRLIGDKECIELQDFLKSIIPQSQWKPSDEEMKALDTAISQVWTKQDSERLLSLYRDLKKLKEE